MIVNVNPQLSDYDESARVMKFCALQQGTVLPSSLPFLSLLFSFADLKTTLSRIDTGRAGPKTKSRINTEGFEGAAASELVGAMKPPALPAPSNPVSVAPANLAADSDASDLEAEVAQLRAQLQESAAFAVRMEAQIREGEKDTKHRFR